MDVEKILNLHICFPLKWALIPHLNFSQTAISSWYGHRKYPNHLMSHQNIPHLRKPCIVNSEGADGAVVKLTGLNFLDVDGKCSIFKIVSIIGSSPKVLFTHAVIHKMQNM